MQTTLSDAQEALNTRYMLTDRGIRFEHLITAVANRLSLQPQSLIGASKEKSIAKGRALVCYWAARGLGMSMTEVANRLKIAVPTVSVAVQKGRQLVADEGLVLSRLLSLAPPNAR